MTAIDQLSIVVVALVVLYVVVYCAVAVVVELEKVQSAAYRRDHPPRQLVTHAQGKVWISAPSDSDAADILLELSEAEPSA